MELAFALVFHLLRRWPIPIGLVVLAGGLFAESPISIGIGGTIAALGLLFRKRLAQAGGKDTPASTQADRPDQPADWASRIDLAAAARAVPAAERAKTTIGASPRPRRPSPAAGHRTAFGRR